MFKTIRHTVIASLALVLFATTTWAQSGRITLAWDANTEPDVAGYTLFWGSQPGSYTSSVNAGNVTSYTVTGLTGGRTYYFAVQAFNSQGGTSSLSQEVTTTLPKDVNDYGETVEAWKARFGITDMAADPDGDDVDNQAEFEAGTDPTIPNTWYLAEGGVGFFAARLALANPGIDAAEITVTFLREGASSINRSYTVAALSRMSIDLTQVAGLYGYSFSTTVTAQRGGVIVERTMGWGGSKMNDAAHTGKAVRKPSNTWYFAEGEANYFDTYLLLANANASAATVTVTYLIQGGQPVQQSYEVAAASRRTIHVNEIAGVAGKSFSMSVVSSLPVCAERAMYFSARGKFWKGGTDSTGAEETSTTWFVAEGHTGKNFDEYLLLANPNASAVTATVRFLLASGAPVTRSYQLAPLSRTTVYVDGVAGLQNAEVSAAITATAPIVVERSMYWPANRANWQEAHNSVAASSAGTKWAMSEGQIGGENNATTDILLANPTDQDAQVTLTILRDNSQSPVVIGKTVKANSRLTVSADDLPLLSGEYFGFVAESTNKVPFVVERSMYWDASGLVKAAGTNETGVKLQ